MDKTLYLNIFSLIILILIYINVHNHSEKVFLNYKLFICIIIFNICVIPIDILSWAFDKQPGALNTVLNSIFNLLLYIVDPVIAVLWILYSDLQIFKNEVRTKKITYFLTGLLAVNAIASGISFYTGWFFKISADNIYKRGDYYWIHIAFCYVLLAYAAYLIVKNRDKINKKYFISMLLFPIPPAVGGILQALFYGLSLSWCGMCLSILMIYFSIQNRGLITDYLTGVYNRRHLDNFIRAKIRESSCGNSFSAILVDIDNFKNINDAYGHETGDEALQIATGLLRKSVRDNDFIARFGGDEFYIILDICDKNMLETIVDRINESIKDFNLSGSKPYNINFSMGFDVYNHKQAPNFEDFLNHIDLLMYNEKNRKHRGQFTNFNPGWDSSQSSTIVHNTDR